ncbi:MAG: 1-deoxy-D-xylulose-5-phosphate reductoisomerase [Candidatus Aquicultorales bacterium]
MKRIVILGSSGSIGRQALDVVRAHPDEFSVVGLAVHSNIDILSSQIKEFGPEVVAVGNLEAAASMTADCDLIAGDDGVAALAGLVNADFVLNALVGSAGLRSTLAAIAAGKVLGLANKESMVAGGAFVNEALNLWGGKVIPVDSEHSALFQCLEGEDPQGVARLILTGSGGPFRGRTIEQMRSVTVEEALAHPRWSMGPKITVDSATMMNKGLEVIEAHYLFGFDYDLIEVVIHPQSIVHSAVEFSDSSFKAQLGPTDMRIPIQYALTYPSREPTPAGGVRLADIAKLTFEEPDVENFPALGLAIEAGKAGGAMPAVLNAANEEAVAAFLAGKLAFTDITGVVESSLETLVGAKAASFDILMQVEAETRSIARQEIEKRSSEVQ